MRDRGDTSLHDFMYAQRRRVTNRLRRNVRTRSTGATQLTERQFRKFELDDMEGLTDNYLSRGALVAEANFEFRR